MSILESAKRAVEKITGVARPGKKDLAGLVRGRKPNAFRFKDDGLVPNHPAWPLVVYRGAVRLPDELAARLIDETVVSLLSPLVHPSPPSSPG